MIIRIRIGHWRFTLTLYEVTDVTGVNSLLKDGNHILMWDFDDQPLWIVKTVLSCIQHNFELPKIRILNTGKKDHYIAYCFKRCTWWAAKGIIAATPFVCDDYFKWGVFRKRFTLRVTPKEGRKIKLAIILPSSVEEDVCVNELDSWVKEKKNVRSFSISLSPHIPAHTNITLQSLPRCVGLSAQNMRHSQTIHQLGE